ncbi:hypothetical protein KEM54_005916 [Ascosphaera aggregata]|nr:hypothetical protein KEM54_005916 [Ascosphaera aggregata]
MSFLNSIISSIETKDPSKYAPPPAPARKPRQPSASAPGSARSSADTEQRDRERSLSASSSGVKRRADTDWRNEDIRAKVARSDAVTVKSAPRELPQSKTLAATATTKATASSQLEPGVMKPGVVKPGVSKQFSLVSKTPVSKTLPTTPSSSANPVSAGQTKAITAAKPINASLSTSTTKLATATSKPNASIPATKPSAATKPAPPAPVQSKPPPKGSYAEIMARAKALQEKAPAPPAVGLIKHQPQTKERLSKAQLKKKAEEAKLKEREGAKAKKAGGKLSRSSSDISTHETRQERLKALKKAGGPEYRGTARPPAAAPEPPAYKGTARKPPQGRANGSRLKSGRNSSTRRSHLDKYLGTDEEDEGGDYFGGYDDYYSESSDMEAGISDVEEEEALALMYAKKEDEEELRAEMAAKREKLERKKRFAAAAAKR